MAVTPRRVVRCNGLRPSCHHVFAASRKISHEPSPCEIDDGGARSPGAGTTAGAPTRRLAGSWGRERPRRASHQVSSSNLVPMPKNGGSQAPSARRLVFRDAPPTTEKLQRPPALKPRSERGLSGLILSLDRCPCARRNVHAAAIATCEGEASRAKRFSEVNGTCRRGAHPPKSGLVGRPMVHDSVHAGLRPVIFVSRPLPAGAAPSTTRSWT